MLWDEGIAFKRGVPFISFQYFLQLVSPPPPTHLQAQTQLTIFKHSTLEGNKGKTQNLIIYKQDDAHVQNTLEGKATKMDI